MRGGGAGNPQVAASEYVSGSGRDDLAAPPRRNPKRASTARYPADQALTGVLV
jgi:hypothetical protein